jgi:hypothetical protein
MIPVRKRRIDMTDIEAAEIIAKDVDSATIQRMIQAFVFHDSLITLAIVIFQITSLAVVVRMPHPSAPGDMSSPAMVGVYSLAAVLVVLLLRHGRIRQGWIMAIAYGMAREREKASKKNAS